MILKLKLKLGLKGKSVLFKGEVRESKPDFSLILFHGTGASHLYLKKQTSVLYAGSKYSDIYLDY